MADNQAGIMALPENQDMQKLSIYDSYDATNEALAAARPDVAQDLDAAMAPMQGIADDFTDQQLDLIIELVQYLYENKEEYAKNIAEFASEVGIEGVFPPEYDPEFLAMFGSILLKERKSRGADQPPFPEKFARGGIAEAARIVANQGRYGDTMLAHITPEEARMLRRQGGSGSINPVTGLPEYWNLIKEAGKALKGIAKGATDLYKATVGKVLSGVAKTTKEILASPIGRIAATIALTYYLGPTGGKIMSSAWAASATASATVTLASGGSVKDAAKAAAFAAISAPDGLVGSYVSGTTAAIAGQNEFAKAALNFGANTAINTGIARLSGANLEDAVKQGLTSATVSLGVDLAQKGLNYKSAGDKVTELADVNKGKAAAEYMSAKAVNPDIELENDQAWWKASGTREFKAGQAAVDADVPPNQINTNPQLKTQAQSIADAEAPYIQKKLDDWTNTVATGDPKYNYGPEIKPLDDGIFSTPVYPDKGAAVTTKLAGGTTPVPGEVPTYGASIKKIGGGFADFAQGKFKDGFGNIVQGAEDLFLPSDPTPAQVAAFEKANPNSPITALPHFFCIDR